MTLTQLIILLSGAVAIGLTQCAPNSLPRRVAPVIGIVGQPFWLIETYTSMQWGMFGVSVVITVVWAKGCYDQWWRAVDDNGRLLHPEYKILGRLRTARWQLANAWDGSALINRYVGVETRLRRAEIEGGVPAEECRALADQLSGGLRRGRRGAKQ